MITLTFEGQATTPIDTATGLVISPEPYQRATASIHLIRSQSLANLWKQQLESTSQIGDFVVRTDAKALDPYQISNGYIQNIASMRIDGTDEGWVISLGGIYYINSSLWNL